MADDDEFAAKVTAVAEKQLLVKEGEDIDYRGALPLSPRRAAARCLKSVRSPHCRPAISLEAPFSTRARCAGSL